MKSYKLLMLILPVILSLCFSMYAYENTPLDTAPAGPSQTVTFTLTNPPKLFLKPDSSTILLINRVSLQRPGFTDFDTKALKASAFTALEFAGETFKYLPHVGIINLTDSTKFGITSDSITSLTTRYHADYTLALTGYTTGVKFNGSYGGVASFANDVQVHFTLYLNDGGLQKQLIGDGDSMSVESTDETSFAQVPHPTVGGSKDELVEASQMAVLKALKDYLPHDETVSRPLYTNKKLARMVSEIMAGHYDKAYRLAQPLLQSKDASLAGKAAYNMAVVYEAQGDLDAAADMAQLSDQKFRNAYADIMVANLKVK